MASTIVVSSDHKPKVIVSYHSSNRKEKTVHIWILYLPEGEDAVICDSMIASSSSSDCDWPSLDGSVEEELDVFLAIRAGEMEL